MCPDSKTHNIMVKKFYGYIPTMPVSVDMNPCYNEKRKTEM